MQKREARRLAEPHGNEYPAGECNGSLKERKQKESGAEVALLQGCRKETERKHVKSQGQDDEAEQQRRTVAESGKKIFRKTPDDFTGRAVHPAAQNIDAVENGDTSPVFFHRPAEPDILHDSCFHCPVPADAPVGLPPEKHELAYGRTEDASGRCPNQPKREIAHENEVDQRNDQFFEEPDHLLIGGEAEHAGS